MKPIKLLPSSLAKAKQDILQRLDNLKLQGTTVTLTYDFSNLFQEQLNKEVHKPIIYMTASTYLKMLEYVLKCDAEIAWHGTVVRGEGKKKHIFFIKDVYLYPQKITGATVKTDDTAYTQWSDAQTDEEYNNRRFQGHSHVNMGTTYSSVDIGNQNEFLQDLSDNDYYIFLVTNKRQEHNFKLYDLQQNILFENNDIDFRVYLDENTLLDVTDDEIEKNCEKEKPAYSYQYNNPTYNFPRAWEIPKPPEKKKLTKSFVVLLNRKGRDFKKEFPECVGDIIQVLDRKVPVDAFIPLIPFRPDEITLLKQEGWHVKKVEVPAEYEEILGE